MAENTPAERVPSHGTDQLGQTYAYDFVRTETGKSGFKFFRGSMLRYLVIGITLEDCHGWSEPIHAPFRGIVMSARDGWPERGRLHPLRDFAVDLKRELLGPQKTHDLRSVLGNHIILKMLGREVFAFFAHCRTGSVCVREGDEVQLGQQLAEVGHSGSSTAPHLHFHLMDKPSILKAKGLPCCFREYEALHDGVWSKVSAGLPKKREFIRYLP